MSQVSHIVVVGDPAEESLQSLQDRADVRVTVVENLQQVKQEAHKRPIDGLVLSEKTSMEGLRDLPHVIDVSKTLIMAGPLSVQEVLGGMKDLLDRGHRGKADRGVQAFKNVTLEDYVESKFVEFVRVMKASSARSLHATLIQAVERLLIQHALRETRGNQIQAAQLLGINRNTLRKKMAKHRIPAKRRSHARQRVES